MTSSDDRSPSSPWQLREHSANLQTPLLNATVDLCRPGFGLHEVRYTNDLVAGHLLGVAPSEKGTDSVMQAEEAFARGIDLAASYPETKQQSHSLEVYWRVSESKEVTVIEQLLSLETSLLECFPSLTSNSQLEAQEAWVVPSDGSSAVEISENYTCKKNEAPCCIVIRPKGVDWSYAEMQHPDDQGKVTISKPAEGQYSIHRELAGAFLEKGVIRKLRICGGFISRENDLQTAKKLFEDLAAETPPLTA